MLGSKRPATCSVLEQGPHVFLSPRETHIAMNVEPCEAMRSLIAHGERGPKGVKADNHFISSIFLSLVTIPGTSRYLMLHKREFAQ